MIGEFVLILWLDRQPVFMGIYETHEQCWFVADELQKQGIESNFEQSFQCIEIPKKKAG